jgi:hypothetical protein
MSSSTPLSYSLGADDISKIVDAILPKLSPFLSGLTNNDQYVLLHEAVLKLSKGKTFSNKDELDTIVKDMVRTIAETILSKQPQATAPDYRYYTKCNPSQGIGYCTCYIGITGNPICNPVIADSN